MKEHNIAGIIDEKTLDTPVVQAFTVFTNRRLHISSARNFRDLGGYPTVGGQAVRWGVLYRSDSLHKLTNSDLKHLSALGLYHIVDFRSQLEKEREPDRLPAGMLSRLVEIPILDSSTQTYQFYPDEFVKNLKRINTFRSMVETNVELATRFTPEIRKFIDVLLSSNGQPVLFHCAAGKDRTGFAAAVLLRLLGVPFDVVMEDYLLSNKYFFAAHRWSMSLLRIRKGKQFAEAVAAMLRVDPSYLAAAFRALTQYHGSFENYVRNGLKLGGSEVEYLKFSYLE